MWIERSIGGKEFVGLSVKKKKKKNEKEIHHWHESFFLHTTRSVVSLLFLVLFCFILSYCYFFFFSFLTKHTWTTRIPISMYKYISYNIYLSKDNVKICICITSSFIFLFFIIYYYRLLLVSLFFFFNISHILCFTLYFIYTVFPAANAAAILCNADSSKN